MNRKNFQYPNSIKFAKTLCKFLIPLLSLLTIYIWFTVDADAYQTKIEYIVLMTTLPIFPIFLFMFLYSWSNLGLDDNGLWIEFIGGQLYVPWKEIQSIQYSGSKKFGVWLVGTNEGQLTFIHRIYSLLYTHSNKPGFVIHPQIHSERELIAEIKKRTQKS